MTKEIKCILVDVDNVLISEIEEVDAELGNPNCKLINPVKFESLEKMKPLLEASNDTEYMIRSEDILTIADPTPEVIAKYLELTS
jgi:predicted HAD superfamily phosphohydrolase YqeG|tara:strand:- start:544 stop:798 length:255 start_codon:yes stop_codon:yes gene_type:complete